VKHVWIVNHYLQEPGLGNATRHYSLARYLPDHGWRAVLVGASVELNSGRRRLTGLELSRIEQLGDVDFLWLRVPVLGSSGGGPARLVNMGSFCAHLETTRAFGRLPRPDVVVGSSVHPFAAYSASRIARRLRVPFVFEIRDLWPETLVAMGMLARDGRTARMLYALERRLVRAAARIITTMPRADRYLCVRHGVPPGRVVWISNGAEAIADIPELAPAGNGRFRLAYFGAHGRANALETLIDAVALCRGDVPVTLRLYGAGAERARLIARCSRQGLDEITFHEPVPRGELASLAESTDAFVLCSRNLPQLYRFGVSMNKLFEYMALGRPIIAALEAAEDPVSRFGAGITVAPESPRALADGIRTMAAATASERQCMAQRGRDAARAEFSYGVLADRLAQVLDAAWGGSTP